MEKRYLLLAILLALLLLFACSREEDFSYLSTLVDNDNLSTSDIQASSSSKLTSDSEVVASGLFDWNGYTGYSLDGKSYNFLYADGRDLRWEEIVLQIANSYLSPYSGHPYLSERMVVHRVLSEDYFNSNTSEPVILLNKSKQESFIHSVNELILNIHDMTDAEVIFCLAKIIIEINESHTTLQIPTLNVFPLAFRVMYYNGHYGIYCSSAPKEYADLIGCRLLSVNEVEINEVLERLSPYSRSFDEHSKIVDLVYNSILINWEALQIVGVVGKNDLTLTLEFEDENGSKVKVSVDKMGYTDFMDLFYSNNKASIYDKYPKPYYRSRDEELWYEMFDDATIYVRISTFMVDMKAFSLRLKEYVENKELISRLILDLRDNGGGYSEDLIYIIIRNLDSDNIYILTNSQSKSASLVLAQAVRRYCKNVLVLGSYGWHTNFLGSPAFKYIANVPRYKEFTYSLPNSAVQTSENTELFSESTELFTPNVFLYDEYGDFIEGKDTFLEWIKSNDLVN